MSEVQLPPPKGIIKRNPVKFGLGTTCDVIGSKECSWWRRTTTLSTTTVVNNSFNLLKFLQYGGDDMLSLLLTCYLYS